MAEYIATYLVEHYTLADAFYPNPGWGKQRHRCQKDELPAHADGDILKEAWRATPKGYRLANLLELSDGVERFIFREPAQRLDHAGPLLVDRLRHLPDVQPEPRFHEAAE